MFFMAQKLSAADHATIAAEHLAKIDSEDVDSYEALLKNVREGAETLSEGLGD